MDRRRIHSASAVDQTFAPQQVASFGFNGAVLRDHSAGIVGGGIIVGGSRYLPASRSLAAALAKSPARVRSSACGVLASVEAHYLYCAAPVVHSDGSGPSDGTLVVLRTLNAAGVAAMGRRADLSLIVLKAPLQGSTTRIASDLGALQVQTRALSGRTMELLVGVPAVDAGSQLVLASVFGRPVHTTAMRSAITSAEIISILGIALLGISILAQRMAVRRRNRDFQAAVREAAELGGRVDPPARDLAVLAVLA